jgi:hypothetical protein
MIGHEGAATSCSGEATTAHEEAVVALLRRLGETSPSDAVIQCVDCGLHSGFRSCCVVFFVEVWRPLVDAAASLHARGETREQLLRRADPHQAEAIRSMEDYRQLIGEVLDVGYVPCPSCALRRDFVEVLPCRRHLTRSARDRVRRALSA